MRLHQTYRNQTYRDRLQRRATSYRWGDSGSRPHYPAHRLFCCCIFLHNNHLRHCSYDFQDIALASGKNHITPNQYPYPMRHSGKGCNDRKPEHQNLKKSSCICNRCSLDKHIAHNRQNHLRWCCFQNPFHIPGRVEGRIQTGCQHIHNRSILKIYPAEEIVNYHERSSQVSPEITWITQ